MAKKGKQVSAVQNLKLGKEIDEKIKQWCKENSDQYKEMQSWPKSGLIKLMLCERFFRHEVMDAYRKLSDENTELVDSCTAEMHEHIPVLHRIKELVKMGSSISAVSPKLSLSKKSLMQTDDDSFAAVLDETLTVISNVLITEDNKLETLAKGRPITAERKKRKVARRRAKLKKAVSALINHPTARLKYPENKDVADFLYKNGWNKKCPSRDYFGRFVGKIIAELKLEAGKSGLISPASG